MLVQNKVLLAIFSTVIILFLFLYLFVPVSESKIITFIMTVLSGILSLLVLCHVLVKIKFASFRTSMIIISAYIIRVILGVFHYVCYFGVDGFYSKSDFNYLWDYQWLHEAMVTLSEYWNQSGFGIPPPEVVISSTKYVLMTVYMSLYYYLSGNNHYLNIIAINSFYAVLVAVLVSSVSMRLSGESDSRGVLLICLFQPFGLGSSIFWRDSIGQLFVISGIIMITSAKVSFKGIMIAICSCFLMIMQRAVYVLHGIIMYLFIILKRGKAIKSINGLIVLILFSAAISIYGIDIFNLSFRGYIIEDSEFISLGWSITPIIERIVKGFVGPFPWHQIFNYDVLGREYLLFDMLQSSFCLVIIFMAFKNIYNKIEYISGDHILIIIAVILFMVSGVISFGHTPYVAVATVTLLGVMRNIRVNRFFYYWSCTIMLYLCFSCMWYFIKKYEYV